MNYFELKKIESTTTLLPWKHRSRSFSEGVFLLSKYLSSDFPNLHIGKIQSRVVDEEYLILHYGDISEVLQNDLTEQDAKRLFELGWYIDDGVDVLDGYFKLRL